MLRRVISAGYLTVCEFDDHPNFFDGLQQPSLYSFSGVHAVQTSTVPLAEVLRRQNPEIAIFPNAIPRLPSPRNFSDPARTTLFFGGLNRENDWPPLLKAMNGVAALAGDRLHFHIVADRGLFDALATSHKEFTSLCDYDTYLAILSRCEISFMPLRDTPFNRCKSDLKFIEAAANRVVALASNVVYAGSIDDEKTGLVFANSQQLQQRLMRIVANPASGRAMADAARAMVARERMSAYQTRARIDWYRRLWDQRHALHAALLARLPELGPLATPGQVLC
jgi:glycosyltransferase involved in cell wall biosynthesis